MKKFTNRQIRYGLRRVRKKLLNGEIAREDFDMDRSWCGTKGCIGGHLAVELGLPYRDRADFVFSRRRDMHDLFFGFPVLLSQTRRSISRRQAADAITRYLDGEPRVWSRGRRAMEEAR